MKVPPTETNGIDFLGWDFAFDVNETAKQFAAENKVNVSFKKIPREVLEKKAVEQGDIKFYELASLTIKTKTDKKKAIITLDNFIIPPDDVPEEVQGKITHWSQWIDYWQWIGILKTIHFITNGRVIALNKIRKLICLLHTFTRRKENILWS
ncbi:MAG: hypothetical protein V1781_02290 [Bacteroidota bacterium]